MTTIDKVEAIALRIVPYSRTSRIVTWLTREHGRLTTLLKGAQKPKSIFLGQYDLFYTCELLYYTRARNGLHIARECSPLVLRQALRSDWRAAACASYLCDLTSKVSPAGDAQLPLYECAGLVLDFLASHGASLQVLFWFELRLLGLSGFAPQLNECLSCNSSDTFSSGASFSWARGGILCRDCTGKAADQVLHMRPDTLGIMRQWQSSASPRAAATIRCTPRQILDFSGILDNFIKYHLHFVPPGRDKAMEILRAAT